MDKIELLRYVARVANALQIEHIPVDWMDYDQIAIDLTENGLSLVSKLIAEAAAGGLEWREVENYANYCESQERADEE